MLRQLRMRRQLRKRRQLLTLTGFARMGRVARADIGNRDCGEFVFRHVKICVTHLVSLAQRQTNMDEWVQVATTSELATSSRHHLTLRHRATHAYHSLLLFSFPVAEWAASAASATRYYCMEATCPHLGAPLENAVIEGNETEVDVDEIEDLVVVCPWHEYDFSLSTGESSHGISACVYACKVSDIGHLYIEPPKEATNDWELVELRPVSEACPAISQQRELSARILHNIASDGAESPSTSNDTIEFPDPKPRTLVAWAVLVLNTPDPRKKVAYTRFAAAAFRSGECKVIGGGRWANDVWISKENETPPERPPRMEAEIRVRPGQEGKRGKGGTEKSRIAILHSLANIEQWAIDLAWDIIARAPRLCAALSSQALPLQFYSDFVKVAEDEAKHFSLLSQRLEEMGSYFGALPVHHGLWDSAMDTAHSLTARLAIIHLVHEARGLDVNPTTITKFANAKDMRSVDTLTVIHLDEITHVSAGHRWMTYLCAQAGLDPIAVFRSEVRQNFIGRLKGPFNSADRAKAGLDKAWYDDLVGQKPSTHVGVQRNEVPGG